MPKPKPWLNLDDYMDYRPPNTDRSTWTKSNKWAFGTSTFKTNPWPPKKKFDKSKCKVCGGGGTISVLREDRKGQRRGIKRVIPCPEGCEYAVKW